MKIHKYFKKQRVYSMKDLSHILSIEKSEIKNIVRSFELSPTIIDNRTWYFSAFSLITLVEFLIHKELLSTLKIELKERMEKIDAK